MPRPAAQRFRGRSTQSKLLSNASALVSVVTSSFQRDGSSLLDSKLVQEALMNFCMSMQLLNPQDHGPVPSDQAKEVVIHIASIDVLPALLLLLRSVSPMILMQGGSGAAGCSDPSCNDGACEPVKISTVLFMVSLFHAWHRNYLFFILMGYG